MAEAWARSLPSTSIVFGLVSGTFIRSSNVTTDSVSCARRLSGLKSKRKPASSGKPIIVAASVADYPVSPLLQKAVQRSQRGITDRIALTGWFEHREQGRKQG